MKKIYGGLAEIQQRTLLLFTAQKDTSVFIAYFCCAVVVGVALGGFGLYVVGVSFAITGILLVVLCLWKKQTWMILLIVIAGVIVGGLRVAPIQKDLTQYRALFGTQVTLKGRVIEDVGIGINRQKQIKLGDVSINNKQLAGVVWVSTQEKTLIKRDYEVVATGKLQEGFGSFFATMYFGKITQVTDTNDDTARETRDWFSEHIVRHIPRPQSDLGIGFLTGQHTTLPEHFQSALQVVGLTHIVVASGYNLTILVRLTRRLLARISKYQAFVVSSLLVVGFMFVTGFSPSIVRAGIVTGLSLATWYYGRKIHPFVLLPLACAISVFMQPQFIWGDLGWYLSFAAFAGVIVLAPLLQHFFFGDKKPGIIRQIIGETLAAQVMTLPIIAFSFGTVSLYALPANILVLPLVPLAMLLVFLTGVTSIVLPIFAVLFGLASYLVLLYMVGVIENIARLPNANIIVDFSFVWLIGAYMLIIGASIYMQYVTKHNFRNDNIVE